MSILVDYVNIKFFDFFFAKSLHLNSRMIPSVFVDFQKILSIYVDFRFLHEFCSFSSISSISSIFVHSPIFRLLSTFVHFIHFCSFSSNLICFFCISDTSRERNSRLGSHQGKIGSWMGIGQVYGTGNRNQSTLTLILLLFCYWPISSLYYQNTTSVLDQNTFTNTNTKLQIIWYFCQKSTKRNLGAFLHFVRCEWNLALGRLHF